GRDVRYTIYVNSMSIDEAAVRTGAVPECIEWRQAPHKVAPVLRQHLDQDMAEGVAWKLAPLLAFPDRHELALDNDVILWDIPQSIHYWLDEGANRCVLAEDVAVGHGAFAKFCGDEPRNSGIRGTPAGFDFAGALAHVLSEVPVLLGSELDEQGLQVAA